MRARIAPPVITVDLEEWFHLLALETDTIPSVEAWGSLESRVEEGTERLLGLLESHGVRASFFCLGWIAERYPQLLRTVARAGHHIGCHSYAHSLVYKQSPQQFREETRRALGAISDALSAPIDCYRAPVFSITRSCSWAFDVLLDLGIRVDCSVAPGRHALLEHGGQLPTTPFRIVREGGTLDEFPLSVKRIGPLSVAIAGGGYFRLLPFSVIARWTESAPYVMTYFHPRDFDPGQPVAPGLSCIRKFRSYVGLTTSFGKLDRVLARFGGRSVAEAHRAEDWSSVPVVVVGA
jgi:polysaccharide deacetylase family protein (PEP-CTERM system associated)